jgi:hypothetical protein
MNYQQPAIFGRIKPHEYKFVSSHGRFMVEPGHLERIEESDLERMFLPTLTREGKKSIKQPPFHSLSTGAIWHKI